MIKLLIPVSSATRIKIVYTIETFYSPFVRLLCLLKQFFVSVGIIFKEAPKAQSTIVKPLKLVDPII